MPELTFYLAGKIQKAHEAPNEAYWSETELNALRKAMAPSTLHFLNPAIRGDDLSDQKSVFGRDLMQVASADIVLVDARDRRGLGVGAEMMWAKQNRQPVIAWAPRGSHYYHSNTTVLGVAVEEWIHPFVEGLSDVIVESMDEAAAWIQAHHPLDPSTIKGPEWLQEVMQYYFSRQFARDEPMQDLAKASPVLAARLEAMAVRSPA